jgi:hypothetical protein
VIDVNFSSSLQHIERKGARGGLRPLIRTVNVVNVPAIVLLIKELADLQEHQYLMLIIEAALISVKVQGEFRLR